MSLRETWVSRAQPFESWWWENPKMVPPDLERAIEVSRLTLETLDITQDFFQGTLLDVGPGPTGRLEAVNGTFIAVEPLIDHYRKLPWAFLGKYDKVYGQPAEEFIPELEGKIDTLISINALDHGYDLDLLLANLFAYLKPGGKAVLSFDVDKPLELDPDHVNTHPICVSHSEATAAIVRAKFFVHSISTKLCFGRLQCWGLGTAYHWRLSKA